MNLFVLPVIGRAGLGNSLFPWARAELFARRSGARVLAPRWPFLRLGPYIRREPDKRHYSGFFRARHHVHGISRLIIGALGRRFPEGKGSNFYLELSRSLRPKVIEFKGIQELFEPLLEEDDFIRNILWEMTEASLRSTGEQYGGRFIAMHVRRGDITRQGFTPEELKEVNQYTPLSWFVSMAQAARSLKAVRDVPIVVFTDGSREEVRELCAVDGVHLHPPQPPISDLWTMAHAGLLFASGYSTFGMWASFLGGMPTLYAPGKIQQCVQMGRPHSLELEVPEGECPPAEVFRRIIPKSSQSCRTAAAKR